MKAYCVKSGRTISPLNDPVTEIRIFEQRLEDIQHEALKEAGVSLTDTVPENEPYILYSDRTWFTSELISRIKQGDFGRLCVKNEQWNTSTGSLQELPETGVYEIAMMHPGAEPVFNHCDKIQTDIDVRPVETDTVVKAVKHPVFKTSENHPFWIGTEMVLQLDHWVHVLRVNQLTMWYAIEKAKREFNSSSIFNKTFAFLKLIMKSRSLNKWNLFQQINTIEKGVDIHPTAVVEFSTLKKGVKIGPFAYVRGCYIGENTVVEQCAILQGSVVGKNVYLPCNVMLNLCVVYPGAMVSSGGGYQTCLFGYDCFIAFGTTILDLSFGKPIRVQANNGTGMINSETNFLGAAIGHRVKIGNAVRIGYGASVPNDSFIVASADDVLKDCNDAPVGKPVQVLNGLAVPVCKN